MSYPEHDLAGWSKAVANLHASTAHDPGDARQALNDARIGEIEMWRPDLGGQ